MEDEDSDPEIQFNFKRMSSSDEDAVQENGIMTSSDEFMEAAIGPEAPTPLVIEINENNHNFSTTFVDKFYEQRPEPSTSRVARDDGLVHSTQHGHQQFLANQGRYKAQGGGDSAKRFDDSQSRTDQIIREAEQSRVRMYEVPGETALTQNNVIFNSVDDDYMMVAVHLDLATEKKIAQGEFVDFSKLIPRDKVMSDTDHWMELVSKGGMTYFVPVSEREVQQISFHAWERAFQVFSHVYMHYHQNRDVCAYDKDFRMHMGRHPSRNWGLILQQAWSFRLKDCTRGPHGESGNSSALTQNKKEQRTLL